MLDLLSAFWTRGGTVGGRAARQPPGGNQDMNWTEVFRRETELRVLIGRQNVAQLSIWHLKLDQTVRRLLRETGRREGPDICIFIKYFNAWIILSK